MFRIPPDPADHWPTSDTPVPASSDAGWADIIAGLLNGIPGWTWATLGGAVTGLLAAALIARTARRRTGPRRGTSLDKAMTFFAAAVATGVVGTGMWAFFGDTLHITHPVLRAGLFAMFEVAMLAEALRSRVFRLDRAAAQQDVDDPVQQVDVDGIAVWVLALISGGLAATHEPTAGGKALRLIAPIVAAWLWERGLAGELRQFTRRRTGRPNPLRVLWDRTLVAVGLAEPSDMSMGERAQARHLNRLARARFKVHALDAADANRVSLGWARFVLRRRFMAAVNQLDLAGNPDLRASLQGRIAVLMAAEDGTSPTALKHLNPWAPTPIQPTRADDSQRIAIDSEATSASTDSPESARQSHPNPTPRRGAVARRVAPNPRTEALGRFSEPTRIGGDEAEMVAAIRPFVADFRARNGKAPGQQVTRNELARFGFRVGTRKAGELAESADSVNLAAESGSPDGSQPAAAGAVNPASESTEPAESTTESDSATDSDPKEISA